MPIFDAGLFALLGGIAFITLILSFKFAQMLKVISAVLFFTLAIVMLAGYDVAYISIITGAEGCVNNTCTDTRYIVKENGEWLGWVFLLFGILSVTLFFVELLNISKPQKEENNPGGFA